MAAAALLLSLLFLASALLFLLVGARSKKPNQPPSPPKLPIIGNLHQMGTLPHHSLRPLSDKYGPLMLLHLCGIPTLIVSSAEMAHEILKTHDVIFASRPLTHAAKQISYNCKDMLFSPYGDYWRQVRKICVLQLLSTKRVHSFRFVREEEVTAMIEQVSQACLTPTVIDLRHELKLLSSGIVARVALGKKYGGEDGMRKLLETVREITVLLGAFCVGDFFPRLAWVDTLTGMNARLKRVSRTMDAFLDEVIQDHEARKMEGGDGNEERDFVDLLLHLKKDSELGIQFTRDNIKAIILDMFGAATETTATTIEWAMAELMKHPNVMEKAQEEVRRLVGRKSKVEEEDLHQMCYLNCIIKETLRLHPPSPLLVPHESNTNVTLQGYYIPPKTTVIINAWAIARDPKSWETPEEFLPERFANNPIDFKGHNFQYIPFGAGRRACPGISFAIPTMGLALANLLYLFDWKLPDNVKREDLDMSEAAGLAINRKFALHIIPVRHLSLDD